MIVLRKLSHYRIHTIAKQIAYNTLLQDSGINKLVGIGFTDKLKNLSVLYEAILHQARKKQAIYTTSQKEEGYFILFEPSNGLNSSDWTQIIWYMVQRIDLGIMLKLHQAFNHTPDSNWLFIERPFFELYLISIKKDYEFDQYAHKILNYVKEMAQQNNADVVVRTESSQLVTMYQSYGFENVIRRHLVDDVYHNDLIFHSAFNLLKRKEQ